jgi:hypothetical protein
MAHVWPMGSAGPVTYERHADGLPSAWSRPIGSDLAPRARRYHSAEAGACTGSMSHSRKVQRQLQAAEETMSAVADQTRAELKIGELFTTLWARSDACGPNFVSALERNQCTRGD